MKLFTITAMLTPKGLTFTEKLEDAEIRGDHTYVTTKGTYYNAKKLNVVMDIISNSLPNHPNGRIAYKVAGVDGGQEEAKVQLVDKIAAQLKIIDTDLLNLANAFTKSVTQILENNDTKEENGTKRRRR